MTVKYGSLPFEEQIEFFRQKQNKPTESYADVYGAAHDRTFMVAGAVKRELVSDFRNDVQRFIEEGRTLGEFLRDFDKIVAKHGWSYNGSRGWRTQVIYETNLQQSYNAGREAQMAEPELRARYPYDQYLHGGSERPRPEHLKWHELTLPHDDPWWLTHSPANGHGCKCRKRPVSAEEMRRKGLVMGTAPEIVMEDRVIGATGPNPQKVRVPKGIDPGFEYQPGAAWLRGFTPPPAGELMVGTTSNQFPLESLPPPRTAVSSRLLPEGLPAEDYVKAFLDEFEVPLNGHKVHIDPAGEPLLISDRLFRDRASGEFKVLKRGREPVVRLLADTIKTPDAIFEDWYQPAEGPGRMRRRYVARWLVEGSDVPLVSVFETGRDGWTGVTAHKTDEAAKLLRSLRGTLVWKRKR